MNTENTIPNYMSNFNLGEELHISITKMIYWKRLSENAVIPAQGSGMAAGYDITSIEDTYIEPGEFKTISTGLAVQLPSDMELQMRPRSGLAAKHGISVVNSPGTIDADYRGEIKAILINLGKERFNINIGDRIAQVVFKFVPNVCFKEVDSLDTTNRGAGGFGSTGIK